MHDRLRCQESHKEQYWGQCCPYRSSMNCCSPSPVSVPSLQITALTTSLIPSQKKWQTKTTLFKVSTTQSYKNLDVCMCMYACVCVCVCVSQWKKKGQMNGKPDKRYRRHFKQAAASTTQTKIQQEEEARFIGCHSHRRCVLLGARVCGCVCVCVWY